MVCRPDRGVHAPLLSVLLFTWQVYHWEGGCTWSPLFAEYSILAQCWQCDANRHGCAQVPPAEAYSEELPSGRLEERNGFLRLVEATGAEEEDLGYAKKWQLLRTQPVGRY